MTTLMLQPTINPFDFKGFEVRTVLNGDTVLFCAKDIYESLGLQWSGLKSSSLKNVPEKWVIPLQHHTTKGERDLIFISEPAVYQAIFRSNSPKALEFTEWVCEEVLPAIRKTGSYGKVDAKTRLAVSKQVTKLVEDLVTCRNLMRHHYLLSEIRDLCNMIGKPMPNTMWLHETVEQGTLPISE